MMDDWKQFSIETKAEGSRETQAPINKWRKNDERKSRDFPMFSDT
jgi:hypothetical protein